ncbi:MAG: hypothetical protein RMJ66_03595 [Bacteroidia bacterium]|nr:hypothetical protein [Bacteroidia bacterium]MDW8134131.1 hypothetical protein [Bacteroidia bacterium]
MRKDMNRYYRAYAVPALIAGILGLLKAQDVRDNFVGIWRLESPCKQKVVRTSLSPAPEGGGNTSGTLTISKDPSNPKRLIILSRHQGSQSSSGGTVSASIEDSLVAEVLSNTQLRIPPQTGVLGQAQEGTGTLQNSKLVIRLRATVRDDASNFYHETESECTYTFTRPIQSRPPVVRPGGVSGGK